jgi:hypothetical protein
MRTLRMSNPRNVKRVAPLLNKLGPIPDKYRLKRIVGGMRWKDYNSLLKPRVRRRFTSPYMMAAQTCIATALSQVRADEQIAIVFDRQDVHEDAIKAMVRIVFKTVRRDTRVTGITFSESHRTVCLDPADYLAFEVREYKAAPNSLKAQSGISILGNGKALGYIYTPERVRELAEFFIAQGITGNKPVAKDVADLLLKMESIELPLKHAPTSLEIDIFQRD